MLTGNLLIHRRRQGRLYPNRLDPAQEAPREAAESVLALARSFRGRRRGDLHEALDGLAAPGVSAKALRGMVKLVLDGCEFAVAEGPPPPDLRRELFDAAAGQWRARGTDGLAQWRGALLAEAGRRHGLEPAAVERALFADLQENQLLQEVPTLDGEGLLLRYNVAQVQGLLLHAQGLEIDAAAVTPQRLRQLLGYLKFFGLLFRVEGSNFGSRATPGARIAVDGPLSVLESSTRYGLELAAFFPALLLWRERWRLRAEVRLKAGAAPLELIVEPHPLLRSHYPDRGQWVPEPARQFVAGFNALASPWRAAPAEEIVALPGNRYLVPDFVLTHSARGPVHLEHLTYPSREAVARKLELAAAAPGVRYRVACRALPSIREAFPESERLFLYRRQLLPRRVLAWIEEAAEGSIGAPSGPNGG